MFYNKPPLQCPLYFKNTMQCAFSSEHVPACDKAEKGSLNTLKGQQRENSLQRFPSIYCSRALEGIVLEGRPDKKHFLKSAV